MILPSGEHDPDSKSNVLFNDVDASTNFRSAEIPTPLLEEAVDGEQIALQKYELLIDRCCRYSLGAL